MSVNFGSTTAVEISASRPTFAPSARSHHGVSCEAYSGNRSVRAASIRRSVAHACQPTRERTGWTPALSPMDSNRTRISVSSAYTATAAMAAGTVHARASPMAPGQVVAEAAPNPMIAAAVASAATGTSASTSAETP